MNGSPNSILELITQTEQTRISPETLERFRRLEISRVDPLTGVPDHGSIVLQIEKHLKEGGFLLLLSLDYLSELNSLGSWMTGDFALCSFADILRTHMPGNSLLGRFSGTTFIIRLPVTEREEVIAFLKKVKTALAEIELPGLEYFPERHLTMSTAITMIRPERGENVEFYLTTLHQLLEQVRQRGGNDFLITEIQQQPQSTPHQTLVFRIEDGDGSEQLRRITGRSLQWGCNYPYLVGSVCSVEIGSESQSFPAKVRITWRRLLDTEAPLRFEIGGTWLELSPELQAFLNQLGKEG
ncbi:MAG: diguanylate cyclase [Lentisphaerae bacterium]|nr:MAG: diguanylate cyclase [Lentisphaerota bacterium]